MNKPCKSSKNFKVSILAATLVLNSAFALFGYAEEAKPTEAPMWKSNIEFGFVSSSGDSETTSINGAFGATYEVEKWKHSILLNSFFSAATDSDTDEDKTSAERYTLQAKTDYKFSANGYAFAIFDYANDRFSDNDYQTSIAAGRGFKFALSETSNLDLEVGVGYRQTAKNALVTTTVISPTVTITIFPEEKVNETIARLAANYTADITEHSKLEQKLSIEAGEESTVSKSYTGLSANVAENLALKLSFTATHQSNVRGDKEALNTVTAVTVVFDF